MYRIKDGIIQVLLTHPGGPFFQQEGRRGMVDPER